MRRRTLFSCAAGALALFVVLVVTPGAPQAQPGQEGGLGALVARVQALEAAVAYLSAALNALSVQVDTLSADLQARVGDLEDAVADLGGALTSYDALAGTSCTTAGGTQGTVHLVGVQRSPICANMSANGRFIDYGLVVLDTQWNLMWEKKTTAVGSGANPADLHDVNNMYNWCAATGNNTGFCAGNATSWIGDVNAEVFAGFSNWRVPTRDELVTIADCSGGAPCIDPIFGPTQASNYWSSTEVVLNIVVAWGLNFFNGLADIVGKGDEFHVRAVRAGP